MSNYLELAQLPDGTIVLRRSDDQDNPIVKIEFSNESKEFLQGQELSVAKEMIRAGIESVSGNVSHIDEFFDNQKERLSKKTVIMNSDKRLICHLSAVFANNFTNHLIYTS